MDSVVIAGAGGHARVLLEILALRGDVEVIALTDPDVSLHGGSAQGIPVVGGDDLLPALRRQGATHFIVGVGGTGDNTARRRVYDAALRHLAPLNAIHPRAVVSAAARLGRGVAVMAGAVVNPGAKVGDNVIINTGAIVEHDCVVGDHAHVATGATLCGGVQVGRSAHVGAGATVRQQTRIGEGAVVGAGAVVVHDVAPATVVAGVPARILERAPEQAQQAAGQNELQRYPCAND
jgi:UDP-perosamine 4-acetyltransferase